MLHDITPTIDESLKVWPGDTPARREVMLDLARGDAVTLSTLHATAHLGAHADAPSHYGLDAPSIEARPLDLYVGLCQVITVPAAPRSRIRLDDLRATVQAPRVLIKTGSYPDFRTFAQDFAALCPTLVDNLSAQGVRLIGIDTPSVDVFDSVDLPAHRRFLAHDMAILEGLELSAVPDGLYELIALPLKLAGFDASPVRAVLRTLDEKRGPA
jgi:arylformamidase